MRWLLVVGRPFGVSLAAFIFLNLALALKEPRLSANTAWLDVPLPEPWLSLFVSLLGAALVVPHAWGDRAWLRYLQCGVVLGFLLLALTNVIRFYHDIERASVEAHVEFPFSLLIAGILGLELLRLLLWKSISVPLPGPARRFLGIALVGVACLVMELAHIYTYGMTDYRHHVGQVSAAVVLGAKVNDDGSMSAALADRIATGVALYRDGLVKRLILSGGVDANGRSEPDVMAEFAILHGVAPQDIIVDREGYTTYLSATNCRTLVEDYSLGTVLVVSQYFHNARVKLIFERAGVTCYTVPANPDRRFAREAFFLFREAMAYPYYLLFHH